MDSFKNLLVFIIIISILVLCFSITFYLIDKKINKKSKQYLKNNNRFNNLVIGIFLVSLLSFIFLHGHTSFSSNHYKEEYDTDEKVNLTMSIKDIYGEKAEYLDEGTWTLNADKNGNDSIVISLNKNAKLTYKISNDGYIKHFKKINNGKYILTIHVNDKNTIDGTDLYLKAKSGNQIVKKDINISKEDDDSSDKTSNSSGSEESSSSTSSNSEQSSSSKTLMDFEEAINKTLVNDDNDDNAAASYIVTGTKSHAKIEVQGQDSWNGVKVTTSRWEDIEDKVRDAVSSVASEYGVDDNNITYTWISGDGSLIVSGD